VRNHNGAAATRKARVEENPDELTNAGLLMALSKMVNEEIGKHFDEYHPEEAKDLERQIQIIEMKFKESHHKFASHIPFDLYVLTYLSKHLATECRDEILATGIICDVTNAFPVLVSM